MSIYDILLRSLDIGASNSPEQGTGCGCGQTSPVNHVSACTDQKHSTPVAANSHETQARVARLLSETDEVLHGFDPGASTGDIADAERVVHELHKFVQLTEGLVQP